MTPIPGADRFTWTDWAQLAPVGAPRGAEWSEADHPRGEGGKFTDSGGASIGDPATFLGVTPDPGTMHMDLAKATRTRRELKVKDEVDLDWTAALKNSSDYGELFSSELTPEQAQGIADMVTSELGKGGGRVNVVFTDEKGGFLGQQYMTRVDLNPGGRTVKTLIHEIAHWVNEEFRGAGSHRAGFSRAQRVTAEAFLRTRGKDVDLNAWAVARKRGMRGAEWDESSHPRDDSGKFTDGAGSSGWSKDNRPRFVPSWKYGSDADATPVEAVRQYGAPLKGRVLNDYLRTGNNPYADKADLDRQAALIDSRMTGGPLLTLYRTISDRDDTFTKLAPGDVVKDKGFISTTADAKDSQFGSGGRNRASEGALIHLEIEVPKDHPRIDSRKQQDTLETDATGHTWGPGLAPNEVILGRGTALEVTEIRRAGRSYRIKARAVSGESGARHAQAVLVALDGGWDESAHPRDESGKFSDSGDAGAGAAGAEPTLARAAKDYASSFDDATEVTYDSTSYIETGKREGNGAGAVLVDAVRAAPEREVTLFRGIGSDPGQTIPELEGTQPGQTLTIGRIASFTEDESFAAYYASMGGRAYQIKLIGPAKTLATDQYSGLKHKEHITQGKFRIVSVEPGDHEVTAPAGMNPITFDKVITVRQEAVF